MEAGISVGGSCGDPCKRAQNKERSSRKMKDIVQHESCCGYALSRDHAVQTCNTLINLLGFRLCIHKLQSSDGTDRGRDT